MCTNSITNSAGTRPSPMDIIKEHSKGRKRHEKDKNVLSGIRPEDITMRASNFDLNMGKIIFQQKMLKLQQGLHAADVYGSQSLNQALSDDTKGMGSKDNYLNIALYNSEVGLAEYYLTIKAIQDAFFISPGDRMLVNELVASFQILSHEEVHDNYWDNKRFMKQNIVLENVDKLISDILSGKNSAIVKKYLSILDVMHKYYRKLAIDNNPQIERNIEYGLDVLEKYNKYYELKRVYTVLSHIYKLISTSCKYETQD